MGALFFVMPPGRTRLMGRGFTSRNIYDSQGVLLRRILSSQDGVSIWKGIDEIPVHTLNAFIAKEDKRFYSHGGVDIRRLLSASLSNIKNGRIVSGASTITMQLARTVYFIELPALLRKPLEMLLAVRLELHKSKKDILEAYMNRTFFGNHLYGIEAASEFYFGKSTMNLTLKESAVLASIPQAPSLYNPYECIDIEKRADEVIRIMLKENLINERDAKSAIAEKIATVKNPLEFKAPHVCDLAVSAAKGKRWKDIYTTIDYKLQEELEKISYSTVSVIKNKNVSNCAVMIEDAATGRIIVLIGSADYSDAYIDGQYNASLGYRCPGSALKPFTYALAIQNGYNASSIIIDEPTYFHEKFGDFKPENYDFKFHGPVTIRQALGCSYNVPACIAVREAGVGKYFDLLMDLGFESHGKGPSEYGVAITLGSMSVSLYQMVRAYTVFPTLGYRVEPYLIDSIRYESGKVERFKPKEKRRILKEWSSYIIADILSDNSARLPAFDRDNPFNFKMWIGAKTGTSKNYKDNFALGFSDRYVFGVWVGNNDQSPMNDVSGITGAGVLFRNCVMSMSGNYQIGNPPALPDSLIRAEVCRSTGLAAGDACASTSYEYIYEKNALLKCYQCSNESGVTSRICRMKVPDEGDMFVIDNAMSAERQCIELITEGENRSYAVILDEDTLKYENEEKRILWKLERGKHFIKLMLNELVIDSVNFSVR